MKFDLNSHCYVDMLQKPSFRIFVIYHTILTDDYYNPTMLDCFTFVNVTTIDISVDVRYHTLKLDELPAFKPLGKWYAESEAMYNIYLNKELYNDVDYIGFIHHDMDASGVDVSTIDELMEQSDRDVLFFQPYTFREDYRQNILMDSNRPNTLRGKGHNCYEVIFEDYNRYYGTNHRTQDYNEEPIGLCAAYLMRVSLFNELMAYASTIIESRKLDTYDITHKYRIPGVLLERYYATWFLLRNIKSSALSLPHSFEATFAQMKFYQVIYNKVAKYLKYR